MKIKASGTTEEIYRLNELFKQFNCHAIVFENQDKSMEKYLHLHLDLDDKAFEHLLYKLEDDIAMLEQLKNEIAMDYWRIK